METGISPKWSKLAEGCLGEKTGRHCHWCEFIISDGDTAECGNKESPYCDEDRIRGWDGIECASKCSVFKLDEWYKDDKNFEAEKK